MVEETLDPCVGALGIHVRTPHVYSIPLSPSPSFPASLLFSFSFPLSHVLSLPLSVSGLPSLPFFSYSLSLSSSLLPRRTGDYFTRILVCGDAVRF